MPLCSRPDYDSGMDVVSARPPGENGVESAELAAAGELVREGFVFEAIALLNAANRLRPNSLIEQRLVTLRHEAFLTVPAGTPPTGWPRQTPSPFPDGVIPEIEAGELTPAILSAAVHQHGSLLVRGLVPKRQTERMRATIDSVFDAYNESYRIDGGEASVLPWYSHFPARGNYSWTAGDAMWPRKHGGIMAADSPRGLFELIEIFEEVGMVEVVRGYLGEQPALSVKKCTLRRTEPDSGGGWHQDGAFLGTTLRTVNVWLALTDAGVDAPGLDLVPRWFDYLVAKGDDPTIFDWTVSETMVDQVSGGCIATPVFHPGDAILFDQMTLHRTAVRPNMTARRYAVETWFFAPSTFPHDQIPLAI